MVEVDGGEGGGQVLRSALALSMLDGEAVAVENVRGDRSDPGLKAQHLTVLETAADVADADVDGAREGSGSVAFDPDGVSGGRYEADIGTAGSVALLFDAFLPLATVVDEPLSITAIGGTDVKWSPPMDYYRAVKLPLLRRFGLAAAVECDRTGFYPDGGGRATLHLWPSTLSPLDLGDAGGPVAARVLSKASTDLADGEVAERQASAAVDALSALGIDVVERRTTYAVTDSPGSVVTVALEGAVGVAGFDAYGAPGKRAEDVAAAATDAVRRFRGSGAVVDAHLADQLLLFLGIAGGRVPIPGVTDHVATSRSLLETFGREVRVDEATPEPTLVAAR